MGTKAGAWSVSATFFLSSLVPSFLSSSSSSFFFCFFFGKFQILSCSCRGAGRTLQGLGAQIRAG